MKALLQEIPIWLFTAILLSCASDPWPEPDDAVHDEDDGQTPTVSEENDSDNSTRKEDSDWTNGSYTGDDGTEPSTDVDSCTGSEESDDDTKGADAGLIEDLIFISTPDDGGDATIVGLSGAVPQNSTLLIEADNYDRATVPVGREGGFALRIPSANTQTNLRLILLNENLDLGWVSLVPGSMNTPIDSVVGDGKGVVRLSQSLVSIHGEGSQLSGGYLVVVANLTGDVGALAPVTCFEDTCKFSVVIPADSGDEVDLFLVPNTDDQEVDYIRSGSVTETIIVD